MLLSGKARLFIVVVAAIFYLTIGSIAACSYTPAQIDDANLNYHYDIVVNDARGVYYELKSGAPGFPTGFWASERLPPTVSLPPVAAPHYRDKTVSTFRIVAHTMGPLIPGGALSLNHWTIYLLVPGGSVQLNMKNNPSPHSNRGIFEIRERAYVTSNSAVRSFDLPATPGVTVGHVEREIRRRRWDHYDMNESGAGCRWWILTVMRGLAEKKYVDQNKVEGALRIALRYNYSRKGEPILLEMKKGVFC